MSDSGVALRKKIKAFLLKHSDLGETARMELLRLAGPDGPSMALADPRDLFESKSYFESLPPLNWLINSVCQQGECTGIGAPAKHGKTWMMLDIAKALLTGKPFLGDERFAVGKDFAGNVIYMTPEAGARPVYSRLVRTKLDRHLYDKVSNPHGRLFVRTLSKGPKVPLTDDGLKTMLGGSVIFLDTAIRFMEGDENSSTDQAKLSEHIFGLLAADAAQVFYAHHAGKGWEKISEMTFDNMFRGSSELKGAVSNAFGMVQTNRDTTEAYVRLLLGREMQSFIPDFMIQGQIRDDDGPFFRVTNARANPGDGTGGLQRNLGKTAAKKNGRPVDPQKQQKLDFLAELLDRTMSTKEKAEVLNEKFGSGHTPQVVGKWIDELNARKMKERLEDLKDEEEDNTPF
jgi:hypothetical protein